MGKWKKPEPQTVRGICITCGVNPQTSQGNGKYRAVCMGCHVRRYKHKQAYTKFKQATCVRCNFIPEHSCQLDVDHIDGNRDNNNEDNLQTLCANCHRLKTLQNKDWQ